MSRCSLTGRSVLIVFLKAPTPAQVKTRMIPALTPDQASRLYRCLAEDTLQAIAKLPDVQVILAYAPSPEFPELSWLETPPPESWLVRPQQGRALGQRLIHAFAWAFGHGAARVVVLGSDAPQLSAAWIRRAFGLLEEADVAIGPATDGGYHLIGLRRLQSGLFQGMPWSTPRLLERTAARIRSLGLTAASLEPVADLDTPEDLRAHVRRRRRSASPRRSATDRFLAELGLMFPLPSTSPARPPVLQAA